MLARCWQGYVVLTIVYYISIAFILGKVLINVFLAVLTSFYSLVRTNLEELARKRIKVKGGVAAAVEEPPEARADQHVDDHDVSVHGDSECKQLTEGDGNAQGSNKLSQNGATEAGDTGARRGSSGNKLDGDATSAQEERAATKPNVPGEDESAKAGVAIEGEKPKASKKMDVPGFFRRLFRCGARGRASVWSSVSLHLCVLYLGYIHPFMYIYCTCGCVDSGTPFQTFVYRIGVARLAVVLVRILLVCSMPCTVGRMSLEGCCEEMTCYQGRPCNSFAESRE